MKRRQAPVDRGADDDGYATIWVVTAMALVAVATAVAVGYGVAIVARNRAAAAADAAGLTAALWAVDGPAAACAKGAAMARLDGGVQTRCVVDGAVAEVVVEVRLPGPLGSWGSASGRARAGPAAMAASGPRADSLRSLPRTPEWRNRESPLT